MSATLNIQQRTDEWLELRKTKVGASDAPIIMGVSPFRTAYQLWQEKLGLTPGQQTTRAMERGMEMEEEALRAFERNLGLAMKPAVLVHAEHEWMIASLDGLALDGSVAVEIKCPGRQDHNTALMGSVPGKYFPQLQHQLAVTGHRSMYYWSFDGLKGVAIEVDRNDDYIDEMLQKEIAFYKCMTDFIAPSLSDDDYIRREDSEFSSVAASWKAISHKLKMLEAEEVELRSQLITQAQGRNCKGAGIVLTKYEAKGQVDYRAIPELKGIDLEAYRKPAAERWRLTSS